MIPQRITDYLRERRIRALGKRACRALQAKRWGEARWLWALIADEIKARSPEQVARMEQAKGLQPRRALKVALVNAHCNGLLPAWAVTAMFRAFRLRRL